MLSLQFYKFTKFIYLLSLELDLNLTQKQKRFYSFSVVLHVVVYQ